MSEQVKRVMQKKHSRAWLLACLQLQELDLSAFKLVGDRHHLWRGALYGGVFVEGPHMYKHEGSYYLMAAEGGTGVNHAEVIAIRCLVALGCAARFLCCWACRLS